MVWGGLRGAVGLAMALDVAGVTQDQQGNPLDKSAVERRKYILFQVGMFTTLTLVINAPTTGIILKKLGLLSTSVQQELMHRNHEDTLASSTRDFYRSCRTQGMFDPYKEDIVRTVIAATMEEHEEQSKHQHLEKADFADAIAVSRDAFLRILNAEYWILTDHGVLPVDTDVLFNLLASVDHAKDHVETGLADWDYLGRLFKQEAWCADKCGVFTNIVFRVITTGLRDIVTITAVCYIGALTVAISRAHRHMSGACLEQVTKEAQQNLEAAQVFLATIDKEDVSMLKTWQLCRTILDFQRDKVHRWEAHGVITGGEAHQMLHHVHHGAFCLGQEMKRYLKKSVSKRFVSAVLPIEDDDGVPDPSQTSQNGEPANDKTGEARGGTAKSEVSKFS